MAKHPKRPRDLNQLAKRIANLATGIEAETEPSPRERRARKAGQFGGPARAAKLTPEQRSEIARVAAETRWRKGKS